MAEIQINFKDMSPDGSVELEDLTLDEAIGDDVEFTDLGDINDANKNPMLEFDTEAVAVNYFRMSNAAIGESPAFSAQGDDANIDIELVPKGTGGVLVEVGAESGLQITATADGASGGGLVIYHDSASPAVSDGIGAIMFNGNDDAAAVAEYAAIEAQILDPTSGSVAGAVGISLANGSGSDPDQPQFSVNGASGSIGVHRESDGAEGAAITLSQDSASPAQDDEVAYVKGVGKNSVDAVQEYGQIAFAIDSPTDGIEAGAIIFKTANGAGVVEEVCSVGANDFAIDKGFILGTEAITATDAGVAADVNVVVTSITTNGDSDLDNVTLPDGNDSGQVKKFIVSAVGNAADSVKITPAKMIGGSQITFAANPLGLGCEMLWDGPADGWVVVSNNGGTIS